MVQSDLRCAIRTTRCELNAAKWIHHVSFIFRELNRYLVESVEDKIFLIAGPMRPDFFCEDFHHA